ncbi:unnamed protein product [Schistosoma margrebowiei]|uniref:Phosphoribosyltransferase domain-containing protein n=1 Tax=Schistosoma margrebowiei TaxID=48269 RepID=A0A3P8CCJ1_9TREM|nr:unnamed protein product [Schistosoma margrebowiei]
MLELLFIRNKDTPRNEFLFNADCLIRLVVEEGLNQLPYENVCVTTPTGHSYQGISFLRGNCGVSVMRSGEAMERGLRDCCRSMRIGKILIQKSKNDVDAKVYYAKFPPNIENRKVLLMYPILGMFFPIYSHFSRCILIMIRKLCKVTLYGEIAQLFYPKILRQYLIYNVRLNIKIFDLNIYSFQ